MRHELRSWPEFFRPLWLGLKTFDYRKDDRNFKPGDTVFLREWNPETKQYTGREATAKITYILHNRTSLASIGLPEGCCVLQLTAFTCL